jgi:hypothetical protein
LSRDNQLGVLHFYDGGAKEQRPSFTTASSTTDNTVMRLILTFLLLAVSSVGTGQDRQLAASPAGMALTRLMPHDIGESGISPALTQSCASATAPCTWERTFGGTLDDKAYAVAATADGGLVVAGHSRSFSGMQYDGWIVRLDRSGQLVWDRKLGSIRDERVYGTVVHQHGIVIAGLARTAGTDGNEAWVVGLDHNGHQQWERFIGGRGNDKARTVAASAEGGFLVGGTGQQPGTGHTDGLLIHLQDDGTTRWVQSYGGTGDDGIFHVATLPDGGIAAVGYSDAGGASGYELWVLRLDEQGKILWERRLGHGLFDSATGVAPAPNGGLMVAGITSEDAFRLDDVWLLRLDSAGDIVWERIFRNPRRDGAWALVTTSEGRYAVAAATESRGAGSTDAWLLGIDDKGHVEWERLYGSELWDRPTALAITSDNGLAVAGYTTSSGAGFEDYWVLRLDENGSM